MQKVYFYNTLTRKKELFVPISSSNVGVYSCGPTVYWNQHLGHMFCYIHWDVLVRMLGYLGYKTMWVMNITDVGHMTSDQDVGEDKMEKGAKRENITVWEIADKYIKQFLFSMNSLNINMPDVLCRATDHIDEQIKLVEEIEKNGFTYKTATGLVFDTSLYKDYDKFAKLDLEKQKAGSRVEIDKEKRNPWDFLLWVTNKPDHVMKWSSPWGVGFPGWHIECTAMSTKYLGKKFDIHTGGKEHISVHHTNEIAQGFGAFGDTTANYWLHNEWLTLKGEKISKSLGNMITVSDIIEKGYDPIAVRYLILNSNYRKGMDFTWEALDAASVALLKLRKIMASIKNTGQLAKAKGAELSEIKIIREQFVNAVADDLNIAKALAVVWSLAKGTLSDAHKYNLLIDFDKILGLRLDENVLPEDKKIPDDILVLLEERNQYRKAGDYKASDKIRDEILEKGYELKDTPSGSVVIEKG